MTAYYIKFMDKNGETIGSRQTHSFNVFKNFYRQEAKQLGGIYIKFTYGIQHDANGELTKFANEGTYKTRKEALLAINAFHEVG